MEKAASKACFPTGLGACLSMPVFHLLWRGAGVSKRWKPARDRLSMSGAHFR